MRRDREGIHNLMRFVGRGLSLHLEYLDSHIILVISLMDGSKMVESNNDTGGAGNDQHLWIVI